jgi:poly(A) polymerase
VVSAERVALELRRMLVHRSRRRALELVSQLGMLTVIIPELTELVEGDGSPDHLPTDSQESHECEKWQTQLKQVDLLRDPSFELVAASLFRHARPVLTGSNTQPSAQKVSKRELSCARVICRRLRMSNLETDHIDWLVAHERELDRAQTLPMSRLKPILANRFAGDLLELLRTRILSIGGDTDSLDFCNEFLQSTPESELDPPPLVSGDDLIASGLKPGKRFKQILAALRDRQLDGVITTKQQAIELAKRFVSDLTDENLSDE